MNTNTNFNGQVANIIPSPFNTWTYYLKDLVASKRAVPLMWGNGFQFNTENPTVKKFFSRFVKDNRLYKTFLEVERILSMWGSSVVTLNRTTNGDIKVVIGDPAFINQVGSVFDEEVGAVVYKTIQHSNVSYVYRETWTDKDVTRWGIRGDKQISIQELLVDVPEELWVPEHEEHNLGFVPVIRFQNTAVYTLWGVDQNWLWHPDDWGCWELQRKLEDTFCQLDKERTYNITRLFGAFTPLDMNDHDWIGRKNPLLADMIIQNKDNTNPMSGGTKQFEVLKADPKFSQYIELIHFYEDQYFKSCGYSPINQAEGLAATATEIVSHRELDAQTTRLKKSLRTEDWNRFFKKALAMAELGFTWEQLQDEEDEPSFFFEIKDSLKITLPSQSEIDLFAKELAMGVTSPVEYLTKTRGMDENQAMEHLDKMKVHNDEYKVEPTSEENSEDEVEGEGGTEEKEELSEDQKLAQKEENKEGNQKKAENKVQSKIKEKAKGGK